MAHPPIKRPHMKNETLNENKGFENEHLNRKRNSFILCWRWFAAEAPYTRHPAHSDNGDEGAALLANGLHGGTLASLKLLGLANTKIGPQGIRALASALTKRAVPLLLELNLNDNLITDEGCAVFASALPALPALRRLHLGGNPASKEAKEEAKNALQAALFERLCCHSCAQSRPRADILTSSNELAGRPSMRSFRTFTVVDLYTEFLTALVCDL